MTGSDPSIPLGAVPGERGRRRAWRSWFAVHALSVLVIGGAIAAHQIAIDPFGVWNTRRIDGWNNLKSSQKVGRLSKPYQYARIRPDVVFLGDSRVGMGMPDRWPVDPAARVFNFGLDDLQIAEAKETVDFMIRTHPPRTLVLGIDLLLFSKRVHAFTEDYSAERLRWVSFSALTRLPWQLKETVFSLDALERARTTVEESGKRPETVLITPGGYRREFGEKSAANRKRYRHYVWNYLTSRYRHYKLREAGLRDFEGLVEATRRAGIDLHVFWVPKSADMLTVVDLNRKTEAMERIKRHVASVVPFWDFGMVSSVTRERNNYYDMSHFLGRVGAQVTARLVDPAADVPPDFGVLVTVDNVEQVLAEARLGLEKHKTENHALTAAFEKALKKRPKKAEFIAEISPLMAFTGTKKKPAGSEATSGSEPPSPKRVPAGRRGLSQRTHDVRHEGEPEK
jgi:hypothetical protein